MRRIPYGCFPTQSGGSRTAGPLRSVTRTEPSTSRLPARLGPCSRRRTCGRGAAVAASLFTALRLDQKEWARKGRSLTASSRRASRTPRQPRIHFPARGCEAARWRNHPHTQPLRVVSSQRSRRATYQCGSSGWPAARGKPPAGEHRLKFSRDVVQSTLVTSHTFDHAELLVGPRRSPANDGEPHARKAVYADNQSRTELATPEGVPTPVWSRVPATLRSTDAPPSMIMSSGAATKLSVSISKCPTASRP